MALHTTLHHIPHSDIWILFLFSLHHTLHTSLLHSAFFVLLQHTLESISQPDFEDPVHLTFCNTSLVQLSILDDIYVPFNEILYELQSFHFCPQFVSQNV
jgi:hypothetical protein